MTTPAINTFVWTDGVRTRRQDGTPSSPPVNIPSTHVAVAIEKRPASTSVPYVNGWRKPASFSHSGIHIRCGRSSFSEKRTSTATVTAQGNLSYVSSIPDYEANESLTLNRSLIACLNNLREQKTNISVFLAELDKSTRLVNQAIVYIAKTVRAFARAYPRDWKTVKLLERGGLPRHRWCEIPRLWLETQYGWKPLMSDVMGIIDAMANKDKQPFVKGKGRASARSVKTFNVGTYPTYWAIDRSATMDVAYKHRSTTELYYAIDMPRMQNAASLGLLTPDELIWELLPWSFIYDWAVPIGPWLGAIHADIGMRFIGGYTSTKSEGRLVSTRGAVSEKGGVYECPVSLPHCSGFKRVAYDTPPFPGLYVKNPLSVGHAANGLSLLAEALRS